MRICECVSMQIRPVYVYACACVYAYVYLCVCVLVLVCTCMCRHVYVYTHAQVTPRLKASSWNRCENHHARCPAEQ